MWVDLIVTDHEKHHCKFQAECQEWGLLQGAQREHHRGFVVRQHAQERRKTKCEGNGGVGAAGREKRALHRDSSPDARVLGSLNRPRDGDGTPLEQIETSCERTRRPEGWCTHR